MIRVLLNLRFRIICIFYLQIMWFFFSKCFTVYCKFLNYLNLLRLKAKSLHLRLIWKYASARKVTWCDFFWASSRRVFVFHNAAADGRAVLNTSWPEPIGENLCKFNCFHDSLMPKRLLEYFSNWPCSFSFGCSVLGIADSASLTHPRRRQQHFLNNISFYPVISSITFFDNND